MDTFARDRLPPRASWPDLLAPAGPARVNAAVELLAHEGTAIAGGWSYAELRTRAEAVAAALAIEPGERVLLHSPNTPEAIACWLGILLAGGIVVATMPLLRAGEIETVSTKARVGHALVARELAGEVGVADVRLIDELPTRGAFAPVDTAADDVAIIAFTSGTTGAPKGCMHFHRDLLAVADAFGRQVLRPTADDVFSGTPPLAFTYGLGASLLFPLRCGASVAPLARPRDALAPGVTILFSAPTWYRAMLERDVPASLRICVSSGEPLPAALSDAWHAKTGIRLLDALGSTEMLHIFVAAPPEQTRPGSCGRPVPGYEARVVDAAMRPVETGTVGRLAVRGPVGCRYLDDPRQADFVIDGWNLTGDAFRMDADGYLWFQARTDDLIVSAGYNISGFEVEAALAEHPAVAECAVVAAPDDERGHIVKAFVVAAGPVTARALQDHVKARIAPYKYPRSIEFVEALPRTPTGKVQRNVLRRRAAATAP